MTIEAKAWKNLVNDQHIYVMQICSGSVKDTRDVVESLKDWKQSGSGFNKKGDEILIFKKDFKDTQDWINWAKNAPFVINEYDKEDSPKRMKTSVVLKDDGKRTCGKCGKTGHNARTCGKLEAKPIKVKGKKICGHCQGIGHNKRTCQSYQRNLADFKDAGGHKI